MADGVGVALALPITKYTLIAEAYGTEFVKKVMNNWVSAIPISLSIVSNYEQAHSGVISPAQACLNVATDSSYALLVAAMINAAIASGLVGALPATACFGLVACLVSLLGTALGVEITGLKLKEEYFKPFIDGIVDAFPPLGDYDRADIWKYEDMYKHFQKELSQDDPKQIEALAAMRALWEEAGKVIYGPNWNPNDYGVNKDDPRFNPMNIHGLPLSKMLCLGGA